MARPRKDDPSSILNPIVDAAVKRLAALIERFTVEVAVECDERAATLIVRDQGIGIAAPDLERIFGPFERAAPTRGDGGLGLGLYITRQLVEAHGGRIDVKSVPGEGTTFSVELPREPTGADHHVRPREHVER